VRQTEQETQEQRAEKDRDFMQTPNAWPQWPMLPVKRVVNGQMQVGTMMETSDSSPGVQPVVYLKNMYQRYPLWHEVEKLEYIDFEGVTDDGWKVD